MDSSAFDEFMRLGHELNGDYEDGPRGEGPGQDQLSLIMNELDLLPETSSSSSSTPSSTNSATSGTTGWNSSSGTFSNLQPPLHGDQGMENEYVLGSDFTFADYLSDGYTASGVDGVVEPYPLASDHYTPAEYGTQDPYALDALSCGYSGMSGPSSAASSSGVSGHSRDAPYYSPGAHLTCSGQQPMKSRPPSHATPSYGDERRFVLPASTSSSQRSAHNSSPTAASDDSGNHSPTSSERDVESGGGWFSPRSSAPPSNASSVRIIENSPMELDGDDGNEVEWIEGEAADAYYEDDNIGGYAKEDSERGGYAASGYRIATPVHSKIHRLTRHAVAENDHQYHLPPTGKPPSTWREGHPPRRKVSTADWEDDRTVHRYTTGGRTSSEESGIGAEPRPPVRRVIRVSPGAQRCREGREAGTAGPGGAQRISHGQQVAPAKGTVALARTVSGPTRVAGTAKAVMGGNALPHKMSNGGHVVASAGHHKVVVPVSRPASVVSTVQALPARAQVAIMAPAAVKSGNIIYVLPSTPASPRSAQPIMLSAAAIKTEAPSPQQTILLAHNAPTIQPVQYMTAAADGGSRRTALVQGVKIENERYDEMGMVMRLEERKMRNRASAQESRIRKKSELEHLRSTVQRLTERNRQLEDENSSLRRKLKQMEPWTPPPRKKVAMVGGSILCVFALLFALPIDRSLSPFSESVPVYPGVGHESRVIRDSPPSPSLPGRTKRSTAEGNGRPSSSDHAPNTRALLALEDYDVRDVREPQQSFSDYDAVAAGGGPEGTSVNGTTGCKDEVATYPNATETIRLNDALDSWVARHARVDWMSGRSIFFGKSLIPGGARSNASSPLNRTLGRSALKSNTTMPIGEDAAKSAADPARKRKSPRGEAKREAARERAARDRAWKHLDMVSKGIREDGSMPDGVVVGPSPLGTSPLTGDWPSHPGTREREWRKAQYEKLAAAVQQRTDTLYVVAMRDYLLLPALERNSTSRPRVSLILPAMNNGTHTNQVVMMRIDVDVVGTGLVNLADAFLPLFNNFSLF